LQRRPNVAGQTSHTPKSVGDSLSHEGYVTMMRSPLAAGFDGHSAVTLSRLKDAVATTLAIGSLSLCLVVTLTVLSIKVSMAMPLPA
jgi:hypothetical protein